MSFDFDELKLLVLEAAEKSEPEGGLGAEEVLFGEGSRLALDSIDALQIAMAIQQRYGIRLNDSKETRRAMTSLQSLAGFLQQ